MRSSKRPAVSVIIPTYNRAQYVTRAIDSVLAQTYKDYEVIVVDDGSTDHTPEVLAPYRTQVRCFRQPNNGVSAARNLGIHHARGEWIAFLDSDDEWFPDKLSLQMAQVSNQDELCVHATNHSLFFRNGERSNYFRVTGCEHLIGDKLVLERPLEYQIRYGLARVPCMMVRQKALLNTSLFDTRLTIYEDQDLMCRLALQGAWCVSKRELVYVYRRDEQVKNLSQQRLLEPLHSEGAFVYLYEKLGQFKELTVKEKSLVTKTLSSCRAALGMELLKEKQKLKARRSLRQSMVEAASLKSVLRYLLALLPIRYSAYLASTWQKFRFG
jgi:glycosyltransferase involved in cell wall biosynthesis